MSHAKEKHLTFRKCPIHRTKVLFFPKMFWSKKYSRSKFSGLL